MTNKVVEFCEMIAKLFYTLILMVWVFIIHNWELKDNKSCLKLAIVANMGCPATKVLGFPICHLNPYHEEVVNYACLMFEKYSSKEEYEKLSSFSFYNLVIA